MVMNTLLPPHYVVPPRLKATAVVRKRYTLTPRNGDGKGILPLVHPGVILNEEFLKPLKLTPQAFAKATGIHATHLRALLQRRVRLTVEDAYRLKQYFGVSVKFWLNLQESYDIGTLERCAPLCLHIFNIVPHPKKKGVLVP